jgi:hypothetical protein
MFGVTSKGFNPCHPKPSSRGINGLLKNLLPSKSFINLEKLPALCLPITRKQNTHLSAT